MRMIKCALVQSFQDVGHEHDNEYSAIDHFLQSLVGRFTSSHIMSVADTVSSFAINTSEVCEALPYVPCVLHLLNMHCIKAIVFCSSVLVFIEVNL